MKTNDPEIVLVVAMTPDFVIGNGNDIPWRGKLPADFKHFRELTMGHPVVMGRKTFESIGKPLPGRDNIVLTRDSNWKRDGVEVLSDVHAVLRLAREKFAHKEIMILGGAEVYKLFLPIADRIEATLVHDESEGDTKFPEFDLQKWKATASKRHEPDEKNLYPYTFETLVRI